MKKLHIDMDLLLELSSEDTKGEGESYLNIESGEFSYIPLNVLNAIEDSSKLFELEEWEKELIQEAQDINDDPEKYLYISTIDEEFILSIMKEYILSVNDINLREKLLNSLNDGNYSHLFNSVLIKHGDIDSFYDFKDYKCNDYLEKWLLKNGIEIAK